MKIINKIALGDKYRYLVDSEIKIMRQLEHKHIVQLIVIRRPEEHFPCPNVVFEQIIESIN